MLSSSTPYSFEFFRISDGIAPKKLPVPADGSRIFPPSKPILLSPSYTAPIISGDV